MKEPTKIINEIREILFKYLDIQKVPDIMNDIRALFNEPENNSIPVELPVKPANGDIAIDILGEKEKYYKKLLKEDVKNHDHIACIVCESKLDFINEMQKELVSRLSV